MGSRTAGPAAVRPVSRSGVEGVLTVISSQLIAGGRLRPVGDRQACHQPTQGAARWSVGWTGQWLVTRPPTHKAITVRSRLTILLARLADDFDKYWSVASKLVPLPSAPNSRAPTPLAGGSSLPSDGRLPDANAMRSVPLRVYLPRGTFVLQTVVSPLTDGECNRQLKLSLVKPCTGRHADLRSLLSRAGVPTTLAAHLRQHLPLLFPPGKECKVEALVQGVRIPLETEVGWLGACLVGADGWVGVVLVL